MTLNELMSQLRALLIEWNGVLKDPQFLRNDNIITWSGAQNTILPERLTRAESLDLSRRRQFSFRITDDDSVLQIAYRFDHDRVHVLEARLGFYEVGSAVDYQAPGNVGPLEDEDPARPIR